MAVSDGLYTYGKKSDDGGFRGSSAGIQGSMDRMYGFQGLEEIGIGIAASVMRPRAVVR
jgi:hypothetical protein